MATFLRTSYGYINLDLVTEIVEFEMEDWSGEDAQWTDSAHFTFIDGRQGRRAFKQRDFDALVETEKADSE